MSAGCYTRGVKAGLVIVAVIVLAALIIGGWFVSVNNQLVATDQAVQEAWAQVQNVYQRRADLIPNLVATVKGVADFEKSTLEAVVEARAKATQMVVSPEVVNDPAKLRQFQAVQGELSGALSRLMAVAENYPQLKASQNFLELQSQLGEKRDGRVERLHHDANVVHPLDGHAGTIARPRQKGWQTVLLPAR